MAIYVGNKKYKLHIGSSAHVLAAIKELVSGILKTSDSLTLKTSDGYVLRVKENN